MFCFLLTRMAANIWRANSKNNNIVFCMLMLGTLISTLQRLFGFVPATILSGRPIWHPRKRRLRDVKNLSGVMELKMAMSQAMA